MHQLLTGRLYVPPVGSNHSYGIRGRRMYKSAVVQAYQDGCLLLLRGAMQDRARLCALRASKRKVALLVAMRFYLPTLWRRDLDGMVKAPLDALCTYLAINDNRVTKLLLEKHLASGAACLEVEVMIEDIEDEECNDAQHTR